MVQRPEHPNTTHIKELVAAGDVPGIARLADPASMPLPYLVMAASHLMGDSKKVGELLRGATDKRALLVEILSDMAKEASPLPAQEEPVAEETPPAPVKKKRRRRTKAQMEAAKAEEAAKAAKTEEVQSAPNPAVGDTHAPEGTIVDFDRAFGDVLASIASANAEQAGAAAVLKRIALDQGRDLEMIIVRQTKIMNALRALESQLMMTGMVLDTEISGALED